MEMIKIVTLAASGLLLLLVGAMRLSNPIKTYLNSSGIQLTDDVNLLNEMRAVGAVMMFGGMIILLGTVIPKMALSSFVVGSLLFLGFAVGRFVSIRIDGRPNKLIRQGLAFEIVLGSANAFHLINALV